MDTKKLRQKILDLAIRGKLVPQDPNDEPASILLERIRAEKERLIKEGKIKRGKKSASDTPHYENEATFEVPDSWKWCIVDDIAYVASGSTPSKDSFVEEGVPYIKMYNLRNQKIDFDFHPQYIKREVHEGKLQRSKTEVGDLIMNIVGPPLGKLAIIPPSLPESNFNQAAVLIRPYHHKDMLVKYLFYYLSEMSEINSISTKGTAGQVNISLTQSQNMRIALPPIEEQKRIISKIDELFGFIEKLDNNAISLEEAINKAKSKIIDLAIHGKLVPQDPNDDPAIELLKRINPSFTPCDNAQYPNIPTNWVTCTVKDVFQINPKTNASDNLDAGFVSMSNICDQYNNAFTFETRTWSDIKRGYTHFKDGDIAVAKISPCLENRKSVVFHDLPNGIGSGTTELNVFRSDIVYPLFGLYFFKSQHFISNCVGTFNGVVGQQRVATKIVEEIDYFLPPYQEQIRIVGKIKKLFAVLDEIHESIEA